ELPRINTLRDVWIQIKELINVATVAREINNRCAGNGVADGLIGAVDNWSFRRHDNLFRGTGNLKYPVGSCHVAAVQHYSGDVLSTHPGHCEGDLVCARRQAEHLVFAARVRRSMASRTGTHIENSHAGVGNKCSGGI